MIRQFRLEDFKGHRDTDLVLERFTVLVGDNGSGKTSLLRLLCGLLRPEEGLVRWKGENVRAAREGFHADLLYLGHDPAVKDDRSALENLTFGLIRASSTYAINLDMASYQDLVALNGKLLIAIRDAASDEEAKKFAPVFWQLRAWQESAGAQLRSNRDFKRDMPDAVVRFLDTGHFALETHASEIAATIRDFLRH